MSHGSLHILNQRVNSKFGFKGNKSHRRSEDDTSYTPNNQRYRRQSEADAFERPVNVNHSKSIELHRGNHSIGSPATILIANHVLEMTVYAFDPGERVILIDKQGFFHFAEPSRGVASAHGAEFTVVNALTSKLDAGFSVKKNIVIKADVDQTKNPMLVNRKHYKRVAA